MFDIAPSEFLLVAFVALVVIGPKDLPKAMRVVGYWVGRARAVGRQFRAGFDEMVREAELEEMEKKWKAENERIMREHPLVPPPPTDTDAADADTTQAPVMVERPRVVPAAPDEHSDAGASAEHDHREPAPMLPPISPDVPAAPHDPVIQDKAAS